MDLVSRSRRTHRSRHPRNGKQINIRGNAAARQMALRYGDYGLAAKLFIWLEFALEELLNQRLEYALAERLMELRLELFDDFGDNGVECGLVHLWSLRGLRLRDHFLDGLLDHGMSRGRFLDGSGF